MSLIRRCGTLVLCCALVLCCCVPAFAAAGSAEDPLITQSYIETSFLPRLRAALAAETARVLSALSGGKENTPAAKTLTVSAGQSVILDAGQQFLLLSGSARLTVAQGTVIDVTGGAPAGNGPAELYRRYIVCEDSRAFVDVTERSVIKTSYDAATGSGSPFTDVTRGQWFYKDVVDAYTRGLINGMTAETYVPAGTLTAAQCVKLASCMHQLWHEGAVTLASSPEGPWYLSYADYALAQGILEAAPEDYDAVVDRETFVHLFYRALPADAYRQINDIPDGAIPDVDGSRAYDGEIYAFYRAGILTGYSADARHAAHAFDAASTISRAEVAVIMNRMFDETARQIFSIS